MTVVVERFYRVHIPAAVRLLSYLVFIDSFIEVWGAISLRKTWPLDQWQICSTPSCFFQYLKALVRWISTRILNMSGDTDRDVIISVARVTQMEDIGRGTARGLRDGTASTARSRMTVGTYILAVRLPVQYSNYIVSIITCYSNDSLRSRRSALIDLMMLSFSISFSERRQRCY